MSNPENKKWNWLVVRYFDKHVPPGRQRGDVAIITVHQTDASKDVEVSASNSAGFSSDGYCLRGLDRLARKELLRLASRTSSPPPAHS